MVCRCFTPLYFKSIGGGIIFNLAKLRVDQKENIQTFLIHLEVERFWNGLWNVWMQPRSVCEGNKKFLVNL